MRNPKLSVELLSARPFFVLGEVVKPGSCARPDTPNAPDVLESEAMRERRVALFLERYELVILDCPPVMAFSDSRIICRLADYTIFPSSSGRETPREVALNAQLAEDA